MHFDTDVRDVDRRVPGQFVFDLPFQFHVRLHCMLLVCVQPCAVVRRITRSRSFMSWRACRITDFRRGGETPIDVRQAPRIVKTPAERGAESPDAAGDASSAA
jgi:hypothetical protein